MAVGDENLVGPEDDDFHAPSDDHWETETCWFSFCVPERKMMGYFYAFVRPHAGISAGGDRMIPRRVPNCRTAGSSDSRLSTTP